MRIHTLHGEIHLSESAGQQKMRRLASHWPLPVVQHTQPEASFTLGFQRGQQTVELLRFSIPVIQMAEVDAILNEILRASREAVVRLAGRHDSGLLMPCPYLRPLPDDRAEVGIAIFTAGQSDGVSAAEFIETMQISSGGAMLPAFHPPELTSSAALGILKLELALVDGEVLLLAMTEETGVFPEDIMDCLALLARGGLRHVAWAQSGAAVLANDVASVSNAIEVAEADSVHDETQGTASVAEDAGAGSVAEETAQQGDSAANELPESEIASSGVSDTDALNSAGATFEDADTPSDEDEVTLSVDEIAEVLDLDEIVAEVIADISVVAAEEEVSAADDDSLATGGDEESVEQDADLGEDTKPPVTPSAAPPSAAPPSAAPPSAAPPSAAPPSASLGWGIERLPAPRHAPLATRESQPLPLGRPTKPLFTIAQDDEASADLPPLVAVVGDATDAETMVEASEQNDGMFDFDKTAQIEPPTFLSDEPDSTAEEDVSIDEDLKGLRVNPLYRLVRTSWDVGLAQLLATAVETCVAGGRVEALPPQLAPTDGEASVFDGFAGVEVLIRSAETTAVKVCVGAGFAADELEALVPVVGAGCSRLVAVTLEERVPPVGWDVLPLAATSELWANAAEVSEHPALMRAAGQLCDGLVRVVSAVEQMSDERRLREREALRDAGLLGLIRRQVALECREEVDAQLDARLTRAHDPSDLRPEEVSIELDQRGADLTLRVRLGATWGEWGVWLRARRVELVMTCDGEDAAARWEALLTAADLSGAQTRVRGSSYVARVDRFDWLSRGTRDELIALIARLIERGVQGMREYALA